MTTTTINRAFRLRRRPEGQLADADLDLVDEPLPELAPGQALVRNLVLSIDPTSRIWMGHARSFTPPVPLGAVMRGLGVGEVVASRREDLRAGDAVVGFTGWQEYCLADDTLLEAPLTVLPAPLPAPPSMFLGVLGHTGITAYLGVEFLAPRPGQTMVVAAAAGAVGSIAGQLAKRSGARVVGIAGGPEKCRHVTEQLGFDACVDYKAPDWRAQLDAATPDGIDLDFENAGGELMDHVLMRLNLNARVFLCGMVSQYNGSGERADWRGLVNIDQIHMQRATVQGFIVTDHLPRWPEIIGELAQLVLSGELHHDETFTEGLESAPAALDALFTGQTRGKLLVRIAEPSALPVAAR